MASPPKPWERGVTATSMAASPQLPTSAAPEQPSVPSLPSVPALPSSLANPSMSAMNPYNSMQSSYQSPYSSMGSSYQSPYSRMGGLGSSPFGGGMGSSMYGGGMGSMGMGGGMGGGYGSYGMNGGGMYGGGMPGMYGGGMGMPGMNPMDPNNPSLTQTLESTTQHTFMLLQSIVQTFSGVAQMLESTFMATHSSFFAMVGVVDQFGQLRNALGSVLGLFGLLRWMKETITGRPHQPALQGEFSDFLNGRPVQGPRSGPPPPKASKKPLIIFLLAIFGVPYAMTKLIRILNERAKQQQLQVGGAPLGPLDPSALTFARALYPFTPSSPTELALKENEIVAIMGKLDPTTGAEVDPRLELDTEWWKGRTREGREGWFPRKWVEVLERKDAGAEVKKVD